MSPSSRKVSGVRLARSSICSSERGPRISTIDSNCISSLSDIGIGCTLLLSIIFFYPERAPLNHRRGSSAAYSLNRVEGEVCGLLRLIGALRKSLPHGPTLFTHLLPRIYACLTPSHAGGCTLSVDPGVVCSFSHSFRSQQPSGWTLPPPSLLLGLPEPHLYATFLWCRSRALS